MESALKAVPRWRSSCDAKRPSTLLQPAVQIRTMQVWGAQRILPPRLLKHLTVGREEWVLLHAPGMLTTTQKVLHVLHRNSSVHSGFISGHLKATWQTYQHKPGSYTEHMGVWKDTAAAQKLQNRCGILSIA